jgi:hypothetical protein
MGLERLNRFFFRGLEKSGRCTTFSAPRISAAANVFLRVSRLVKSTITGVLHDWQK